MISKIITWLKKKDNYVYVIILLIGIVIATYKYDFLSAIIVFGGLIIFSIILGLLIRLFIK
jgi:hypothetical protein